MHYQCKEVLTVLLSWRYFYCGHFSGRKHTCWCPSPSADISGKAKPAFGRKSNANPKKKMIHTIQLVKNKE